MTGAEAEAERRGRGREAEAEEEGCGRWAETESLYDFCDAERERE